MAEPLLIEELIEASEQDVRAIARILPQLSSAAPPDLARLTSIIGQPSVTVFVARFGEEIVGMLTLYSVATPTGQKTGIEDVVVDESRRGGGIGSSLVRAALDHARALGASTVDLTSRPSRVAANELYVRLGFSQRNTNVYRFEVETAAHDVET